MQKKHPLIIVHTGEGKGKTTAALGLAVRSLAHGGKVAMVQFMKSPTDYKYGEASLVEKFPQFELFTMGAGFTWNTQDLELDLATARQAWNKCKELVQSGLYDLVIFDELVYVLDYGFLPEAEVLEFLSQRHPLHLVLTGRNASPKLIALADLVTEMHKIKHPYREQKIPAQEGLEW